MSDFRPIPIVVKDNKKPYKIIQLKYDFTYKDFIVDVFKGEKLLFSKRIDEHTFLSLDRKLQEVRLVYRNTNGDILYEENIELNIKKEKSVNKEDELYKKMKLLVQEEMENPQGTEIEKRNHTECLNNVTIDKKAKDYIMSKIKKILIINNVKYDKIEEFSYRIFAENYGLGVIQELDDDENIGEILVNAVEYPTFKCDIYYFKNGKKYVFDKSFENIHELRRVFNKCIEFQNKEINSVEHAIIEATRPNRDRVNIVVPDASNNYVLNIRKFANFIPSLEMMKKSGTVDDFIAKLFKILIQGKTNIGIGGPMGTGKTTMINFLLTFTNPIERKVVISSVDETDVDRVLKGHDVAVLNVNEEKGFSFKNLIKTSLRTTADRIIIPESRGDEFAQVIEANHKTKGNLFTAHALDDNSFLDMCVDMYMSGSASTVESSETVKNKISKAIDIIVIMRKVNGAIRIKSISEVINENGIFKGLNILYYWDFDPEHPLEGCYKRTNNRLTKGIKERMNEFGVKMSSLEGL